MLGGLLLPLTGFRHGRGRRPRRVTGRCAFAGHDRHHPSGKSLICWPGLGYISELKVGDMAMGRAGYEAGYDHSRYIQGYGIGASKFDKGQYLPVTAALW